MDDLGPLLEGEGGSVHDKLDNTLTAVLFAVSLPTDGRHSNVALTECQI